MPRRQPAAQPLLRQQAAAFSTMSCPAPPPAPPPPTTRPCSPIFDPTSVMRGMQGPDQPPRPVSRATSCARAGDLSCHPLVVETTTPTARRRTERTHHLRNGPGVLRDVCLSGRGRGGTRQQALGSCESRVSGGRGSGNHRFGRQHKQEQPADPHTVPCMKKVGKKPCLRTHRTQSGMAANKNPGNGALSRTLTRALTQRS